MAESYKAQQEAEKVLQDLLGMDRGKINFALVDLIDSNDGGLFRPSGPTIFLNKDRISDLNQGELRDLQYRVAHEAGHAKDFLGRGQGKEENYRMASPKRREYMADKEAMKYFKEKGYDLGPKSKEFAKGNKQFQGLARRFGILPLLFLSGLLPAMALSGKE